MPADCWSAGVILYIMIWWGMRSQLLIRFNPDILSFCADQAEVIPLTMIAHTRNHRGWTVSFRQAMLTGVRNLPTLTTAKIVDKRD